MMDAMWMEIGEEMRGSFRVTGGGDSGGEGREEGNSVSLCDFFFSDFYTNLFVYLLYMKRNLLEEGNGVCVCMCVFSL